MVTSRGQYVAKRECGGACWSRTTRQTSLLHGCAPRMWGFPAGGARATEGLDATSKNINVEYGERPTGRVGLCLFFLFVFPQEGVLELCVSS